MIRISNIETWGFEAAVRGMRNPYDSWAKSDSSWGDNMLTGLPEYGVGESDLGLMKKLFQAGSEHRKYLRSIYISMDITAPLYWWTEYDTYKVGTVANSCSKMHTLTKYPIDKDLFSTDNNYVIDEYKNEVIDRFYHILENLRKEAANGDKEAWRYLVQLLPEGFNQKRTISMNYEVAIRMIQQRENHKLKEWHEFVDILKSLPYMEEIIGD